jgi:hypothetical protein
MTAIASALAALTTAGTAAAYIVGVDPVAVKIAPPQSVVPGALMGPNIHVFDEQQDVILPANVWVDARPVNNGVQLPGDLNGGWIPAGTCVRSHYVQFEPAQASTVTGGIKLDNDILGVALLQSSLGATNFLGAEWMPGVPTIYPVAAQCNGGPPNHDCGMDLVPEDGLRLDARRVVVNFTALSPGDRIRVITKSCGCKPPST